jgi:hypothetical protein
MYPLLELGTREPDKPQSKSDFFCHVQPLSSADDRIVDLDLAHIAHK